MKTGKLERTPPVNNSNPSSCSSSPCSVFPTFDPSAEAIVDTRTERPPSDVCNSAVLVDDDDDGNSSCDSTVAVIVKNILSSRRAFVVGVMLSIFVQITGVNIIFSFSPDIVKSAGITNPTSMLVGTIFIGLWNALSTVPPIFVVDKIGRVVLLVVGYVICFVGNLLVALSASLPALSGKQYALALPGVGIFLLGFEFGPGPVYNVLVSELYPTRARAHAMTFMVTVFYVFQILIVQFYLPLVEAVGQGPVFFALSVFCVVIAVFVFIVAPETKGKELSNA